jgi:hypothetical protein
MYVLIQWALTVRDLIVTVMIQLTFQRSLDIIDDGELGC